MKFLTQNPYSFNYHSLKKLEDKKIEYIPQANQLVSNPVYSLVGQMLGIDTKHEWNEYYDKVYEIVEWAKSRSQSNDISQITNTIKNKIDASPTMNEKRIIDLYVAVQLDRLNKGEELKEEVK